MLVSFACPLGTSAGQHVREKQRFDDASRGRGRQAEQGNGRRPTVNSPFRGACLVRGRAPSDFDEVEEDATRGSMGLTRGAHGLSSQATNAQEAGLD